MKRLAWLTNQRLMKGAVTCGTLSLSVYLLVNLLTHKPDWAGFFTDTTTTYEKDKAGEIIKTVEVIQSGKTLWDWISVLGVPFSLTVLGLLFQHQQQRRTDEQTKLEREIAEIDQREEILQTYFDRISVLLIDKNLIALAKNIENSQDVAWSDQQVSISEEQKDLLGASIDVIRAITLSILRRFGEDGERKSSLIRFLIKSDVIGKLKLELSGANLSRTDLGSARLYRANLKDADLHNVRLSGADLSNANLSSTDLSCANLSNADLEGAYLRKATLKGANLSGTHLRNVNFEESDLSSVINWTEEQLDSAELCNTVLPGGCKLDPNRDCKNSEISTQ